MFTRKSIMQKTLQVGGSTLLSRLLGVIREILTVRYLGASALSDAFFTAWKVPNSLRKIFAEGALSAVFVPTIVQVIRAEGRKSVNGLMTLGFFVFEGMVLLLCAIGMLYANFFIGLIGPGFSPEQIVSGALYLRILMPFIFLISTSALLAGPLQAVGHFFIPAFGPVLLNILYICGLIVCLMYHLPVIVLCWFIMAGGVIQLVAHILVYMHYQFSFGVFNAADVKKFGWVLVRFVPCLLSMSVMEVGLFIDTSFATLLSKGSVSLIYYANRFMGIPLGVFAVALSTTLLPHFSRVGAYAPKRLGFYVLEATKLVWWVTVPITITMIFLAKKIFITMFLSDKFSIMQAHEAGNILIASLIGLFFFSINKILLNVYYAFHQTTIPAAVAVISVIINSVLNWLLLDIWFAVGLASATTIAAIIQTILLYVILSLKFGMHLYVKNLVNFIARYSLQLICIGSFFIGMYGIINWLFEQFNVPFFVEHVGFWVWVGPLCVLFMGTLYFTRRRFGIRVPFLEKD